MSGLHFFVPPGIGDFSAMYQKLSCINREITIHPSMDEPNRIGPYLDLLPNIKNGGYASHGANAALSQTLAPGTDIASLPDGHYFLAINTWLEEGGKVRDWIPGHTDYHYDMLLKMEETRGYFEFLHSSIPQESMKIGVYCSAYGNSRHWGFWGPEEWREFLTLVVKALPEDTQYLFIGAEYDVLIAEKLHFWMKATGLNSHLLLGAFPIAGTTKMIDDLDYFFVFPSGLGFLADVVRTPNLMWFPKHLEKMMGTFCDPDQYETGQSLHRLFTTPQQAYNDWMQNGIKFLDLHPDHFVLS
jgi:hypothetical protein